jgi:hypothetical protein
MISKGLRITFGPFQNAERSFYRSWLSVIKTIVFHSYKLNLNYEITEEALLPNKIRTDSLIKKLDEA